jgi:signal recognition particle GTPase
MSNGYSLLAGWKIPHVTVELLDDLRINTLHKTTVIFTVGVPGSGKSFWAKKYSQLHNDFVIVERDGCRHTIQASQGIPTLEKAVVWPKWSFKTENSKDDPVGTLQKELITTAVADGKNIIISDTNISTKTKPRI